MTSQYIGIETARKTLGDLVTAAQQGSDIILTRNGRAVARIVAIQEDPMSVELIAPLSPEVRNAVLAVIEAEIEREYQLDGAEDVLKGARLMAVAALKMDLHGVWVEQNGDDRGLHGYATQALRSLVAEGLRARECQCTTTSSTTPGHNHRDTCHSHYEADVPPINGQLLCGPCHVDLYQSA